MSHRNRINEVTEKVKVDTAGTHSRYDRVPLKCHLCPRICLDKTGLRIHSRVHTGERPHVCTMCQRGFSQTNNLKRHLSLKACHGIENKLETSATPKVSLPVPVLTNTSKKVNGKSKFRDDLNIQTRRKPSTCPVCNKVCSRPDTLKIHLRIHTGERPYVCTVCRKGFSHKSNLTRHVNSCHGIQNQLKKCENVEEYLNWPENSQISERSKKKKGNLESKVIQQQPEIDKDERARQFSKFMIVFNAKISKKSEV